MTSRGLEKNAFRDIHRRWSDVLRSIVLYILCFDLWFISWKQYKDFMTSFSETHLIFTKPRPDFSWQVSTCQSSECLPLNTVITVDLVITGAVRWSVTPTENNLLNEARGSALFCSNDVIDTTRAITSWLKFYRINASDVMRRQGLNSYCRFQAIRTLIGRLNKTNCLQRLTSQMTH